MIIGVCGFIGSGKGTVGDYLVEKYNFRRDSFAAPLKDAVSVIFGWDREMLEGVTSESREWREKIDEHWSKIVGFDLSPRYALQLFGTECIRNVFHEDVWSASLIKRYKSIKVHVVVTDCRFVNEINAIRKAGGLVWRVKRGDDPLWYHEMAKYNNGKINKNEVNHIFKECGIDCPHLSETAWIGSHFDAVIYNDGTLEDLFNDIEWYIEHYFKLFQSLP